MPLREAFRAGPYTIFARSCRLAVQPARGSPARKNKHSWPQVTLTPRTSTPSRCTTSCPTTREARLRSKLVSDRCRVDNGLGLERSSAPYWAARVSEMHLGRTMLATSSEIGIHSELYARFSLASAYFLDQYRVHMSHILNVVACTVKSIQWPGYTCMIYAY